MLERTLFLNGKIPCACCGYLTVAARADDCPVCFWEQDLAQEELLYDDGGPNKVSLVDARENFKKFGACEERFISMVRPPNEDEMPK